MITTLNIQCNQKGLCTFYASQWGSSEELESRSYTLSFRVLRVPKLQAYFSMGGISEHTPLCWTRQKKKSHEWRSSLAVMSGKVRVEYIV